MTRIRVYYYKHDDYYWCNEVDNLLINFIGFGIIRLQTFAVGRIEWNIWDVVCINTRRFFWTLGAQ